MRRISAAARLVGAADDLRSRRRLLMYFARNALLRWRRSTMGRSADLEFSLGGIEWTVTAESSQLGGIHDVWLTAEYDAFPGFRGMRGSTVLDVGANIGAYTLWQWVNMGGDGRILAVEGSPTTSRVLRRNVQRNRAGGSVEVVERAVWSSSGEVEFLASSRSSSTSGVAETLDRSLIRDAEAITVSAVTLGDLLASAWLSRAAVDVAKIDVEGAECEILNGATDEQLRCIRRFVIEIDNHTVGPVIDRLTGVGFELVGRAQNVVYLILPD